MKSFEKLGAFYLGRRYDAEREEVSPEPVLYDAKDLTTHAVCVGMTGSGKTGLGVALLEEALIDGVPVLAIDPKGDLGNLLLTFPRLRPGDFEPWIDPADAARRGRSVEEEAAATAELWREGLADWGQEPARIARFADAAERTLYTPGSDAGRPLRVLRSFAAPPRTLLEDGDALRTRLGAAVSGLLALLGIDADPIQSREHILLSALLERAWREGRDVDLPTLIHQVQRPPVERIGVLDLETVFPARERVALALSLNNLLASPNFSAWSEGDPMDPASLLYTEDGRPRLSIFSIAHLSERERMFFVTLLLNEVLAWTRAQPGSRTLRAILYMDEVFGYFPPIANPPSKQPMLTLLKQARASGLGVVLATQNPVDLDYKGLSNTGTWFLGRLQTERDKARVLDGLEGASAAATARFDRAELDRVLSGLPGRVFLMHNVHEDGPLLLHTRWVLSYLAGPLTREQIRRLSGPLPEPAPKPAAEAPRPGAAAQAPAPPAPRPAVPPQCREGFLPVTLPPGPGERLLYRPALLGTATLHHADAGLGIDQWSSAAWLAPLAQGPRGSPWTGAQALAVAPELEAEPEPGAGFAELPGSAERAASYKRWEKMLSSHAYRERPLTLFTSRTPKLSSTPGESEGAFRGRLQDALREERDLRIEKLRRKYAPRAARLREQIRRAEQRVDVERDQYTASKTAAAVSVGATVLGALFGRKLASVGNVRRAGGALGRSGRVAKERGDIGRAEERVELARQRLEEMEAAVAEELAEIQAGSGEELAVTEKKLRPRKSDLEVEPPLLLWVPFRQRAGVERPASDSLQPA